MKIPTDYSHILSERGCKIASLLAFDPATEAIVERALEILAGGPDRQATESLTRSDAKFLKSARIAWDSDNL